MSSSQSSKKPIHIGGASGYWGESAMATPQLLAAPKLDYIVYDYLAEITMSILARARLKNSDAGYATDFITAVLKPNLTNIALKGVKLIANAGGVNPEACAVAARTAIKEAGLTLKVAVVTGDDLIERKEDIAQTNMTEMFSGAVFPLVEKITSINAYLGAFPIAQALSAGADIVITGRCVDSAVTLGACIHHFQWRATDWDRLASGSLAGHILECGPQATGGNFTDWEEAGDIANIGYPIAQIEEDGAFTVTKPEGTAGIVNVGTISEQMLYEIGDPQAYILPDVICDFSNVAIKQEAKDCVSVSPAQGYPAPGYYKTCLTYEDGYRAGLVLPFYGIDADKKARKFGEAAFARARKVMRQYNAGEFSETSIEILGEESQYGDYKENKNAREVVLKIAAKHNSAMGVGVLLKELAGLGLATPPGLSGFSFGRPKPSPVIRLFSFLIPKKDVSISIKLDDDAIAFSPTPLEPPVNPQRPAPPVFSPISDAVEVPLIKLAWGRSGDKGNKANIGIIARNEDYYPYIWGALDEESVSKRFSHFIEGGNDRRKVERFALPGSNAINFLIDDVLGGGGVASIRSDPQGKGYAQLLLSHPIPVPSSLAKALS